MVGHGQKLGRKKEAAIDHGGEAARKQVRS
jgi:hypothetical protein